MASASPRTRKELEDWCAGIARVHVSGLPRITHNRVCAAPDPYINPRWKELNVGDLVVSLVDPLVKGEIAKITLVRSGYSHAYLVGLSRGFNLATLVRQNDANNA